MLLLGAPVISGCDDVTTELKTPVYNTSIAKDDTKMSSFEKDFPLQYKSYMKNNESTVMTEYKGSVPFHKNDNVNGLPTGFK